MVEYAASDAYSNGVDHECDFIKELAELWFRQKRDVRIGVVVYHDTVNEAIHITDFSNTDIKALSDRLDRLSRQLNPSGNADLGKALDFVRAESFKGARPDAEKIVVPIVHRMSSSTKAKILPAAQRLKDDCAAIVGFAVSSRYVDYDLMKQLVSQPQSLYYQYFYSYSQMEDSAKYVNDQNNACQ